jgi:hypothetical protein
VTYHINSIKQTSTEDQNNTTADTGDTDDEQIGERQSKTGDDLEESHEDAYVTHSSDPERLDHDSGTSDVVYSDDDV